eukprot:SAG31_NODE_25746_length_455_cov_0.834270_1_plen_36_part_01
MSNISQPPHAAWTVGNGKTDKELSFSTLNVQGVNAH